MSIKMMTRVWAKSKQKGTKLLILLALADFANDEGQAWPAIDTLAGKARCSRRWVQDAIRELDAEGELSIRENSGPHGVHLYTVTPPAGGEQTAPHNSGGAVRAKGVHSATRRG